VLPLLIIEAFILRGNVLHLFDKRLLTGRCLLVTPVRPNSGVNKTSFKLVFYDTKKFDNNKKWQFLGAHAPALLEKNCRYCHKNDN
jgi:hypothetical protein